MRRSNLLDVVESVYDIVCREGAWGAMLADVAGLYGCASAALVYADVRRPAADLQLGFGRIDETVRARYAAEYAPLDPAPAAFARLPVGEAATTDRMFTAEERAQSRFFNEFFRPLGLVETLGARIGAQGGVSGLLAVHRGPERPPFDDEEIATFASLGRHVGRAVDLRRRFFGLEAAVERLETALDASAPALLTLDGHGVLEHANAAARALLARGDALVLHRSGQIGAIDAEASRRLRAVLAVEGAARRCEIFAARARDGAALALRLTPLPLGWRLNAAELRPQSGRDGAAEALRQALGLTHSAAELVATLLDGGELADYARRRGLTLHTARFHLKSAFKAASVHKQAELVRLSTRLLRDLGV